MLEEIVESLQNTIYEGSDYCFPQDLAPAHKVVKEVLQRLMEKVPIFIATKALHRVENESDAMLQNKNNK